VGNTLLGPLKTANLSVTGASSDKPNKAQINKIKS
jgi:hypothetical protein